MIWGCNVYGKYFQCVAANSGEAITAIHRQLLASDIRLAIGELRVFPVHVTKAGQA